MQKYYVICLKLQFRCHYIVWIGDDEDGVLLNEQQKVLSFKTENKLKDYVQNKGISLTDELTHYDIGYVQQWIINPTKILIIIHF